MQEAETTTTIARRHRELRLDVDRLRVLALAAPQALTPGRMKELLERELRTFAAVQDHHFAFDEVRGTMGGIVGTTATLERRVAALHEQHRRLGRHAERILRHAPEQDVTALAREILALTGEIAEHDRVETRLIQSAMDDDLGGVD